MPKMTQKELVLRIQALIEFARGETHVSLAQVIALLKEESHG